MSRRLGGMVVKYGAAFVLSAVGVSSNVLAALTKYEVHVENLSLVPASRPWHAENLTFSNGILAFDDVTSSVIVERDIVATFTGFDESLAYYLWAGERIGPAPPFTATFIGYFSVFDGNELSTPDQLFSAGEVNFAGKLSGTMDPSSSTFGYPDLALEWWFNYLVTAPSEPLRYDYDGTLARFSGQLVATPVPEPETYAMMLGGLGLLGVVARRRKQKVFA